MKHGKSNTHPKTFEPDSSNLLVRMPGILKHDGTFLYYTWKFDLLANWSMPFANAGIHAPHAVLLTSSPAELFF